jgi:hypothetical protein
MVYVDQAGGGVGQAGALQVTAKSGNQITLLTPVPPGPPPSSGPVQSVWAETPSGTIDGANRSYTTANPYTAGLLGVYLNGLRQRPSFDYSETGAQSFQFVNAPLAGDTISVDYIQP